MSDDGSIETWADRLEACIASTSVFDRVLVLRSTGSTQDAARLHADGSPGLIVITEQQTSGRGRLGRVWHDTPGASLAMSFVLDAGAAREALPLVAGLAACSACEGVVGAGVRLRWPNDVVEATAGKKLAGVLIERDRDLVVVGIGINVRQRASDWPIELRDVSCSLAQLGAEVSAIDVAAALTRSLVSWLSASASEVVSAWLERDTLIGTRRAFVHDGETIRGEVISIDPLGSIVVRLPSSEERALPALTTSLVHEPRTRGIQWTRVE